MAPPNAMTTTVTRTVANGKGKRLEPAGDWHGIRRDQMARAKGGHGMVGQNRKHHGGGVVAKDVARKPKKTNQDEFAEVLHPFRQSVIYFGFVVLMFIGHIRDFLDGVMARLGLDASASERRSASNPDCPPLVANSQDFYTRRLYMRIVDIFNRPISSAPGSWIDVMERAREGDPCRNHPKPTGRTKRCLNLGSYNYLGFAAKDEYCTPRVIQTLAEYGCSTCSSSSDAGMTSKHVEMEGVVAEFLGVESAFVYGMGFATNAMTIPVLADKNTLIISDEMNHKSIVDGVKLSGARVKVFKHNNTQHLEYILRKSIVEGHPRTKRPWRKIIIIVEGIYSMEGEMVKLREIVALKKKYKAYLYLDEAHSIGALGRTGRGVCEQLGVDPRDVDVMMGTFTKSFGSCGGYIAGKQEMVEWIRSSSPAAYYATSMSPSAVQQVISALKIIAGEDGTTRGAEKLNRLSDNSNYFRQELKKRGFHVLGDQDSPVVPIMCYYAAKIPALSRLCLERGLAVVLVGFPATALCLSRMRICISAAHTREELKLAIDIIDEIGDKCMIKYLRGSKKVSEEEESYVEELPCPPARLESSRSI
ncbi:pyridoxal phosphate-dependent transferase [Chloropicon primus]|uniref:serine C-palmitoyltransferase n=1 Tax=Chloropicon primus TaxID=1764295 RepID=A0A5B8MLU3_9CHLO|nr:pyridoxal phosphate-dependent transferase [Chloropicon primus]UPR00205.1 pyridoxal phosphate-dependent transferase [Chloropicon primus]|mmetsp:Transcript_8961/g.25555  ORF Transcript_8961/g.25555 Transcript_8961/m.25555 type:complete len:589 (-) Transcript_8961:116-1882(-)|eukprot:QDZ20994.1 pyridoxal phosphate-dependent transferase [Chloropicon primus]